jgi:hypothetical protein
MGQGDLSDTLSAGADLGKLIKDAMASNPAAPASKPAWDRLVAAGLDMLDKIAKEPDETYKPIFAALIGDENAHEALGAAFRFEPDRFSMHIEVIRQKKGGATTAASLARYAKAASKTQNDKLRRAILHQEQADAQPLRRTFHRTDLPEDLTCPPGYVCGYSGVGSTKVTKEGDFIETEVSPHPIFITKRYSDIHDKTTSVELTWYVAHVWSSHVVPRLQIADAHQVVGLADLNAPVNTVNAGAMVKWLSTFESHNQSSIPTESTSSRMGWQGDDFEKGFLIGSEYIPFAPGEKTINLVPADNMDRAASGFTVAGTWGQWLAAVETIRNYPIAYLAIYASVASILLKLLKAPSMVVDWSCDTSMGKTTILRLAASVWGMPDDRDGGIIHSWNTTQVGYEHLAGLSGNLPVFMDDTSKASKKEMVATIIYQHSNGAGKIRGSRAGGNQNTEKWWSMLLSTGESCITTFTEDAGTRARTLAIHAPPFGREIRNSDAERRVRMMVDRLRDALLQHHGHLGRRIVEYLRDPKNREKVIATASAWKETNYTLKGGSVAGRLLDGVAALYAASEIIHEALGVPRCHQNPIDIAMLAAEEGGEASDIPRDALQYIFEWAVANAHCFWGRHIERTEGQSTVVQPPQRGWYGKWLKAGWGEIAIICSVLNRTLKERNFPNGTISSWKDRGWLEKCGKEKGDPWRISTRIGSPSEPVQCFVIRKEVIEAICLDGAHIDDSKPLSQALYPPKAEYDDDPPF